MTAHFWSTYWVTEDRLSSDIVDAPKGRKALDVLFFGSVHWQDLDTFEIAEVDPAAQKQKPKPVRPSPSGRR